MGRGVWREVPGMLSAATELSGEGLGMVEEWTVLPLACEVELGRCKEMDGSNMTDGLHIISLVDLNPARLEVSMDGAALPAIAVLQSAFGSSRIKLHVPPVLFLWPLCCLRVVLGLTPLTGDGVPSEV